MAWIHESTEPGTRCVCWTARGPWAGTMGKRHPPKGRRIFTAHTVTPDGGGRPVLVSTVSICLQVSRKRLPA